MKLVIIESPNKIKKLKSILPSDYEIVASVGHMFDLPKKDLGIDTDTFEMDLILDEGKKDILSNIKKLSDQADAIYLASDADREGSAISKNIYDNLTKKNQKKCHRLLINAITKDAVEAAIKNPTTIDLNLYNAQKGRRVTDRLVGYKISPIMWTKGLKGTSAGRVQSVALKYIADLEKEVQAFKAEEYWKVILKNKDFSAELFLVDGEAPTIKNEEEAKSITKDILSSKGSAIVSEYLKKVRTRSPEPPFITSTIQQAASNIFGWNAQKTMQVAQALFSSGMITYLRCFPGDTRISTPNGMIPISNLSIGNYVDTIKGPRKILDVVKNSDRQILSLHTKRGYNVNGSVNEPLLVVNEDLSISWVKMQDIKPGQFVALANSEIMSWPESTLKFEYNDRFAAEIGDNGLLTCCICGKNDLASLSPHLKNYHNISGPEYCKLYNKNTLHTSTVNRNSLPGEMSIELAKILGYMSSEGYFDEKNKNIVFCNTDNDLLDDFAKCYNAVFKTDKKPYHNNDKFEAVSQSIWSFLNWLGLQPVYANQKRVPWSIMQGTKEQAIAFLKAYWEGDGSYNTIISSSEGMVSDIKILLLKLGIPTSTNNHAGCKSIQFSGSSARKFFKLIGEPISKSRIKQSQKILNAHTETRSSLYSWHNKIPYTKNIVSKLVRENISSGGWLKTTAVGSKIRVKTAKNSTWNRLHGEIGLTNFYDKNWGEYIDYSISKEWVGMSLYDFVKMCDPIMANILMEITNKNCHWDQVSQIKKLDTQDTWDLTVDDQSHFIAEGFIAHNTDSIRIEPDKIKSIREKIDSSYGQNYLSSSPRIYANKDAAQDAHEAIRPTYDAPITPLSPEEKKLLDLVDRRFKASQMADATFDQASLRIEVTSPDHTYTFKINGSIMTFDGFLKVYGENKEDLILPQVSVGTKIVVDDILSSQHFTQPPGRYSDASIIKKLEKEGVGRPSTYASIIETIINRGYVERDKKSLHGTELGIMVSDFLSAAFPNLVSPEMTSKMETDLDLIAEGKGDYKEIMSTFYSDLTQSINSAKKFSTLDIFKVDRDCPDCNSPLLKKKGEYGIIIGCSTYPKCGYIIKFGKDGVEVSDKEETGAACPDCGSKVAKKNGKFGEFYGCSSYPNCTWVGTLDDEGNPVSKKKAKVETTDVDCTACGKGKMIKRAGKFGDFLGCEHYPTCKNILNLDKDGNPVVKSTTAKKTAKTPLKSVGKKCPKCNTHDLVERDGKFGKFISCSGYPNCKHIEK